MLIRARPVMMSAELDACGNTVGADVTSAPQLRKQAHKFDGYLTNRHCRERAHVKMASAREDGKPAIHSHSQVPVKHVDFTFQHKIERVDHHALVAAGYCLHQPDLRCNRKGDTQAKCHRVAQVDTIQRHRGTSWACTNPETPS